MNAPVIQKASPQQQAVYDFVTSGSGNALVQAVAGAGKTTTLIGACSLMSGSIAFAAYNKKIAVEIEEKVKARGLDVRVGTFHSYGYSAWRKVHPKCKLDPKGKWADILENVPSQIEGFVQKLVGFAKQRALGVAASAEDAHEWYQIITHFNLMEELEDSFPVQEAVTFAQQALKASIAMAPELIDFDDMIYMPLVNGVRMWQYDWVLVDEAQDLNNARRMLARKMLKRSGRIIFVGDRHQAIYGFTGADNDGLEIVRKEFSCQELPLTVTYRCPKAVVAEAQRYVSHIQAAETAPEGKVVRTSEADFEASLKVLQAQDAVLCRKTKPLVSLAYTLIRNKIACHVEGREIGQGLIALTTKWKRCKTPDSFLAKLEEWSEKRAEKMIAKGQETAAEAVMDRYETMVVICEGKSSMDEVRAFISDLFKDTEDGKPATTVTLSTVHKSKGREWGRVYILGFAAYMPSPMAKLAWEREQEVNLIYVGLTRAMDTLTLVG
jgi:DNA helicase-2/ATP-dependent DNA helicase PcrA